MFRGQTEATLFPTGTVPVPVPVLSRMMSTRTDGDGDIKVNVSLDNSLLFAVKRTTITT